jgi:ribonuclease HI
MREIKLFFDGGCRPNPGEIEVAVVAGGRTYLKSEMGIGTNDDAEWLALLYALEVARGLAATEVLLVGDSALVVNQASGLSKCRSPNLQGHLAAFRDQAGSFHRVRVRHVRRNHNLAGIALAAARWAA